MNNNTKNILLGVLVVGLVGMTIAYAALSTRLQISGTATVPDTRWDVRLSNLTKVANTASAVPGATNTAQAADTVAVTNGTAITGLAVTFNQPGDKVVYNFTISNLGSIDAKLSAFNQGLSLPANYNGPASLSNFTSSISCNPSEETQNADYLNKKGSYESPSVADGSNHDVANCTLTLQWNEATNVNTPGQDQTYTQEAVTLDYNAQWTYVQK